MQVFDVPANVRIRLTSKMIRWVERTSEKVVVENITWEGTTTDEYIFFKKVRRRLIVNHTVDSLSEGIWQSNTECEIVSLTPGG